MYPLLMKFLLEENVLDKFIVNKANNTKTMKMSNSKVLLIDEAFMWNESPEGQEFWLGVEAKYQEYLNKKLYNNEP